MTRYGYGYCMGEPQLEFGGLTRGCDLELRLGGALATAARSRWAGNTPDPTVWNELPGNRLLFGVGRLQDDSDSWPGAVRETVTARLLAGEPLPAAIEEAQAQFPSWGAAVYAINDPALVTIEAVSSGPGASFLRLDQEGQVVSPSQADEEFCALGFAANEGETLVALACDPSWSKVVAATVEQIRKVDFAALGPERLAGPLCERLCRTMSPAAAAVVCIGGEIMPRQRPVRPSMGQGARRSGLANAPILGRQHRSFACSAG